MKHQGWTAHCQDPQQSKRVDGGWIEEGRDGDPLYLEDGRDSNQDMRPCGQHRFDKEDGQIQPPQQCRTMSCSDNDVNRDESLLNLAIRQRDEDDQITRGRDSNGL
jgi:hypothetical protein